MIATINNQIATTYHSGAHIIITNNWKDFNIVVPDNKFYFIKKGEIEIRTKDKTYIVTENEWLLLPAGILHSYNLTNQNYAEFYWLHFQSTINGKTLFSSLSEPIKLKVEKNTKIINLFNKIYKNSRNNTTLAQLDVITNVNNLILTFMSHLPSKLILENNDIIDELIEYITHNYIDKISLTELATKANFSTSQFIKIFKKRTGVSPIYYLNLVRLEHAKYLLEQTNSPIGDIMEKTGFFDSAYFSKMFKKYYNISPTKYRAMAHKKKKEHLNPNFKK